MNLMERKDQAIKAAGGGDRLEVVPVWERDSSGIPEEGLAAWPWKQWIVHAHAQGHSDVYLFFSEAVPWTLLDTQERHS